MSKLVIVESPAKAKTIAKYLGKGFSVTASMGHIRDLPKSQMGVDIDNEFTPKYIPIRGKADLIKDLKKQAKASDMVYLATDPDREGEAISWHLAYILGLKGDEANRVTFNEITKTAVKAGIAAPRKIDIDRVNAQQARRILDRIVGYKLSPFLWKKIKPGLSAGRVQSVTVRLIVDREDEIRAFVSEEYWTIDAKLATTKNKLFTAHFHGDKKGKISIKSKETADDILGHLKNADYVVSNVKKGVRTKSPAPPFITSTLQQEASRKFGFQAKRTMSAAQQLYEGVEVKGFGAVGLITYMRTDSLRISDEAKSEASKYIGLKYGENYLPKQPRVYKVKAGTQDAHEAIRPSMPSLTPAEVKDSLTNDQYRLYKLIWERFIASQMESALYDTVHADISADRYIFKASGNTVKFAGFTVLYEEGKDEKDEKEKDETEDEGTLPPLEKDDALTCKDLSGDQHFTQPPARYTEASLIKALEENGIGRPSTYAPTITTVLTRGYVEREQKALLPTQLGEVTTKLMKEHFSSVVDVEFTANIENELDKVETGDRDWVETLAYFYKPFADTLTKAEEVLGDVNLKLPDEETDIICEICGRNMVIKQGRFGKFLACPGYPECKNTKQMPSDTPDEETDLICETCGKKMVIKQGRYGKFIACVDYPTCKTTKKIVHETEGFCPICGGKMLIKNTKKGKRFFACEKNPECTFVSWDEPIADLCPVCNANLFKKRSRGTEKIYCAKEGCGYVKA